MSDEVDKNYLASLDRRITDHDNKIAGNQKDHTELVHEIKELMNRINNGVSPSVNAVRKENSEIKLQLADLSHKMDISLIEMKSMVRESAELSRSMVTNFEKAKLEPLEKSVDDKLKPVREDIHFMKKTFIYGLVGAVIVFGGQKVIEFTWDRVFRAPVPASVKSEP
jgi:hypothetical protein